MDMPLYRRMVQTMRWFGPADPVRLSDIRQAGCSGVVTALHEEPTGAVWPMAAILERKQLIEKAGLQWTVVESLPVHEQIKTGAPGCEQAIENYKTSIRHLAAAGIRTIAYNFMPVLDWTRTDLAYEVDDGSRALRFETAAFAAFDVHILRRPHAEDDYDTEVLKRARARFEAMSAEERQTLQRTILAGLPGSEEGYTLDQFQSVLDTYHTIDAVTLRKNLIRFLQQVVPVAEQAGVQLAIHPDDPPFPLLGLPRVVSTKQDLHILFDALPSLHNGLCFCTGSLGVRPDNDLVEIARTFGERIHFLHLRSTRRNELGDFFEDNHLEGDVDMFQVVSAIVDIMHRRGVDIPMRPDHGHQMLDDLHKSTNPGYSAIGRLRGLAELRGLELGILMSRSRG